MTNPRGQKLIAAVLDDFERRGRELSFYGRSSLDANSNFVVLPQLKRLNFASRVS
jgi:hypothetical protein